MANKKPEASKAVEVISDITLLKPATIHVEIEWHDGKSISVPMKTLSFGRFVALGREFPAPQPPVMGGKRDGTVIYDYKDAGYLRACAETDERRTARRLVEALALDIPGDSIDAKIDYILNELDARVVNSLGIVLNRHFSGKLVEAQSRAENFLANGNGDSENLS